MGWGGIYVQTPDLGRGGRLGWSPRGQVPPSRRPIFGTMPYHPCHAKIRL